MRFALLRRDNNSPWMGLYGTMDALAAPLRAQGLDHLLQAPSDGPWRHLPSVPANASAPQAPGLSDADIERCFPLRVQPDHQATCFDSTVLLSPLKFEDWAKGH